MPTAAPRSRRPPRPLHALFTILIAALLAALGAPPATAQTFTRVNDPAIAAKVDTASAASWVDADGDGDLDLFVATWSSLTPNRLFLNNGAGVFTLAAVPDLDAQPYESFGSTWADADNDGRIDLYVSQLFNDGGALYRNDGGAAFTRLSGAAVTGGAIKGNATWGDFDLDGRVDLVFACLSGTGGITTPNRLFLNQGNFVFAERDTGALHGVVGTHHTATWADYDNDGDPDLFFASGGVGTTKRDRLWQNMLKETGSAWLKPITTGSLATDLHDSQLISWADVDNDGDLDAYVLNYTTFANMLYRNDGGGVFTRVTTAGPIVTDIGQSHGCAWGDYDNDGDLDVVVARDGGQTERFYRNDGAGNFTSVTTGTLVTQGRSNWSVAAGDMDRDGDLDLFLPVRDAAAAGSLFRNDLASGAHWLELGLEGVLSSRAALGARVRLKAVIGGVPRWQVREVSAGTSYGGQNMLDVHFGLADAAQADSIEIVWPSGIRQAVMTGVAADRWLIVQEHASTAVESALLSASATPGRVELVWWVDQSPGAEARIERREGEGPWQSRGTAEVDASRRVRVVDSDLPAGTRLGYRLGLLDEGSTSWTDEVVIEVPAGTRALGVTALAPPGGGLRARLELPAAGSVSLDVLDAAGRRALPTLRSEYPAGRHEVTLADSGSLRAGVYWMRLTHPAGVRTSRALVLR